MNETELSIIKQKTDLLSRMALNLVCGLPLDQQIKLEDEDLDTNPELVHVIPTDEALNKRPEIQMLTQAANIAVSKEKLKFAELLPTVALTGSYLATNPSAFNGVDKRFEGMFRFGVLAKVPLFHFGERIHTLNASRAGKVVAALELEDAKEKIELQINQSLHQTNESLKKQMQTPRV